MNLSELSNEGLAEQLYREAVYYDENLRELCYKIQKQLPRKFMMRIISYLYRVRTQNKN